MPITTTGQRLQPAERDESRLAGARDSQSNTNGYRGLCLDPCDLAVAKLVARREKDLEFVDAMLRERLVSPAQIRERIPTVRQVDTEPATALIRLVDSLESVALRTR